MIGTKYYSFVDENRQELLGNVNCDRKVALRLYYPAKNAENAQKAELFTEKKKKLFGKKADLSSYNQMLDIYENVEIADGCFPLILFSHGYGGMMEQNNVLCQALAQKGYIVASVGHAHEAVETIYNDGSSDYFDKSMGEFHLSTLLALPEMLLLSKSKDSKEKILKKFNHFQKAYKNMIPRIQQWALDSQVVIDQLKKLNQDEDCQWFNKIDFSNGIGATGHSFGGCTAYYMCLYNKDISCGVNIDGGLFGYYDEDINHKPFMQIDCETSVNVVSRAMLYKDKPTHFLVFKDMAHNGFTDLKYLSKKKALVGAADVHKAHETLNEAHVAFFNRYLKQGNVDDATYLPLKGNDLVRYEIW